MIFAHMTNTKNCVRLLSLRLSLLFRQFWSVLSNNHSIEIFVQIYNLYIQIDTVSPMLLIEYPIWPLILPQ